LFFNAPKQYARPPEGRQSPGSIPDPRLKGTSLALGSTRAPACGSRRHRRLLPFIPYEEDRMPTCIFTRQQVNGVTPKHSAFTPRTYSNVECLDVTPFLPF
jgi:hypothetical protein